MRTIIVGSGLAGVTLAEELRKKKPQDPVTLITREVRGYYSRPMLSHGFARDDIEQKIILKTFDALSALGIEVLAGADVATIDRRQQELHVVAGGRNDTRGYDRLVLAVGSEAQIPPPLKTARDLFHVINDLDDLIEVRALRTDFLLRHQSRPHWAVIGGGLIGCEVASDLAKAGDPVTLFHAMDRLMERQLLASDSDLLLKVLKNQSIAVNLNTQVQGLSRAGEAITVHLSGEDRPNFNGVLVATGFKPRTQLAQEAGLPVNLGILVDEFLKTVDPSILALGDAAEFPDGRLYPYVMPIRQQALWLAEFLTGATEAAWIPPSFTPRAKVHGFVPVHPQTL